MRASAGLDPTVYPVEEKVGEHIVQRWIVELLRPLVERWLRHRRMSAFVGADQFIYYRQHVPTQRIAPDVYVLPGIAADRLIGSWKTWETGVVPQFALEIVSRDWEKDYVDAPERYREMGVQELVIFDPRPEAHPDGVRWQVYRRVRGRPLALVETSRADRVRSRSLGAFVRAVGTGSALRLRVASGSGGDDLFPTAEEEALQRVAALEAELAGRSAPAARPTALHGARRRPAKRR